MFLSLLGACLASQSLYKINNDLTLRLPESSKPLNLASDGDVDIFSYDSFNDLANEQHLIKVSRINKGPLEHYYESDALDSYLKTARSTHDNDPFLYRQQFIDKDPTTRQPISDRLDFFIFTPSGKIDQNTFAIIDTGNETEELFEAFKDAKANKFNQSVNLKCRFSDPSLNEFCIYMNLIHPLKTFSPYGLYIFNLNLLGLDLLNGKRGTFLSKYYLADMEYNLGVALWKKMNSSHMAQRLLIAAIQSGELPSDKLQEAQNTLNEISLSQS